MTNFPNENLGLESREVNYLGKFFYSTKYKNTLTAHALFSSKGHLLIGDVRGNYAHKKLDLGANYEIVNQSTDSRLSEDLRTMNFTSAYNLSDDFLLNAGGRYDLSNKNMAQTSLGFSFDLGSWSTILVKSI